MALFNSKKKAASTKAPETAKKPAKAVKKAAPAVTKTKEVTVAHAPVASSAAVIVRPRITEKSGILAQSGVYTFEISKNANKASVAAAVKTLYKVEPVKVAVVNVPARNVFVRGRKGVVSGFRKAMVTLKKGDKIEFV